MVRQANGFPARRGRGGPRGGTFRGATFRGGAIRGTTFRGGAIRGTTFRGGAIRGTTFRGNSFRGNAFGGRSASLSGRGGIHKPPPLMSRPMPPPSMRPDQHRPRPIGPPIRPMHMPLMDDFEPMGPPRLPHPGIRGTRGGPNLRMGPRTRPPLRGLPSPGFRGRGALLPPPHPMPGPPTRGMFRPRPPVHPSLMGPMNMRGRGMPGRMIRGPLRGRGIGMGRGMMITRGSTNILRGGVKTLRGRGQKAKTVVVTKEPKTASPPSAELNKPWVTEAMKNEILKKHKLHQKAKKAKTKEDWEIFKEHRNKVTTMLREAKIEYIGAHPEEDVDKILAEATTQVSDKDETNEGATDDSDTTLTQGAEPMEEGGAANEAEPPQDPEVEMTQESVSLTEPETEPDPEPETAAAQ